MACVLFAGIMPGTSMRGVDCNHVVLAAARKSGMALLQERNAGTWELAMRATAVVNNTKTTVLLDSLGRKYRTCHGCTQFSVHNNYQGLRVNPSRCWRGTARDKSG